MEVEPLLEASGKRNWVTKIKMQKETKLEEFRSFRISKRRKKKKQRSD